MFRPHIVERSIPCFHAVHWPVGRRSRLESGRRAGRGLRGRVTCVTAATTPFLGRSSNAA